MEHRNFGKINTVQYFIVYYISTNCWWFSVLTGSFSEVIQDTDWPSALVWWRICVRADAQELSAVVCLCPPLPVLRQHRHWTLPEVERIWWQTAVRVCLSHITSALYILDTILTPFISFVRFRLPADVSLVVYTEGARTDEGWDFLLEKYKRSTSPSEKWMIKAALAYTPLTHKLQWWVWMHEAAEVSHDIFRVHPIMTWSMNH